MAQLEYANLANLTLADADDPHAYRFSPPAWRFAWLWWNLGLLTALAAVLAIARTQSNSLSLVLDACKTDFLLYAPLSIGLSILLAHGKIDLSFPLQQILALMVFGAMTPDKVTLFGGAPPSMTSTLQAAIIATSATMVIGFLNWWMCSILRAPSAVATLLLSLILLCTALAVVPDLSVFSMRNNNAIGESFAMQLLWITLAASLLLTCLVTLWLLKGRTIAPREQQRRELGAELFAFVLVSVCSAVMGILVVALPTVQGYVVGESLQMLGMPQVAVTALIGVLVGGTVLDGKLPNPIGALLGGALAIAGAHVVASWSATGDMYTSIFVRAAVGHAPLAAATLVILLYGRRLVTILRASQHSQYPLEAPSWGAWALAGVALIPWIMSPLVSTLPDALGLTGRGPERASRIILGISVLAASFTYIALVLADALLCKQHRSRRA